MTRAASATTETILSQGSLAEIGSAYRAREFSIVESVQWYLDRIEKVSTSGPALNAVRVVNAKALETARFLDMELASGRDLGPLHGIPVLLKDNVLTADGMTATAGARALAEFKPKHEATLVRRLRDAGAVVLGKTNLTEFADFVSDVMPSEFSGAGGVVRNPHGIRYDRGQGSSVGSAASVAAALSPFAIGSETQNSIQTPACYSSVVGFKPTVGMVSRSGLFPLVASQDSPGPLARSVEDARLVFEVIAAPDPRDTVSLFLRRRRDVSLTSLGGVRIGVPRKTIADKSELNEVLPLFEEALSSLSRAGAKIVDPCDLPTAEQLNDVRSCVFRAEFKSALNAFLELHGSPCGIGSMDDLIRFNERNPEAIPYGQPLLIAANGTGGTDDKQYPFDRARDIALSLTGGIEAAFGMAAVDLLMAPMGSAAKCTGKAGAPVVALPVGASAKGIPFGITLFARPGDDLKLLAAAQLIERQIGDRRHPKL